MNVLFDSNVIVAFLVQEHSDHNAAYDTYLNYANEHNTLFISTHSLAEIYRTLTWGVEFLDYTAAQANQIIRSTVLPVFDTIELNTSDYKQVLDFMVEADLQGSIIYDALISRASQKIDAEALVTFNIKDFQRVWPLTNADLIEP
jgi:predicted nucleic acid-binding protein